MTQESTSKHARAGDSRPPSVMGLQLGRTIETNMTDRMHDETPSATAAGFHTSGGLWSRYLKQPVEWACAILLLVVLSPVLLLIALAIKLTSPGPLFFMQDRAGRNGAVFRAYKFRTMRGGRRPDPKELVPLNHPEITGIGRPLRRFKLDELPQLINVVRGEMTIIGPRPTLPDQVAAYDEFRRRRLLALPGLTGLAQVNCNAAASWDERILYDVAYVSRCSFLMDMGILLRTIVSVIAGEEFTTRPFASSPYARFAAPPAAFSVRASSGASDTTT